MNTKLFDKAWFGSVIEGAREIEDESTFNHFDFDELPLIHKNLTNDFAWLPPYLAGFEVKHPNLQFMENQKTAHEGVDYSFELQQLEKELNDYGIILPEAIKLFLTSKNINSRIRSTTDNYFEVGEYIEVIQDTETYYLLHFMSDSQYCLLWYICFDEKGNHFILVSPQLFGHKDCELHNEDSDIRALNMPRIGYYCAHNFLEFIYRYDLEERIWFKTRWFKNIELNEEEQNYIKHYLDLKH